MSARRIFYGALVHSISLTELEYLPTALLGVNDAGVIAFIDKAVIPEGLAGTIQGHGWEGAEVVVLKRGEFLCPGLIDTHTHAPQYPNLGYGQQYELLDWLTHVTFPTEEKFANAQYARRTYEGVVQRVLNTGTTTSCYYGTLHLTTKILAAVCHRKGQRAFVGKCNMDRNSSETYQEASASASLADTKEFVNFVRTHCLSPSCDCSADGLARPMSDMKNLPQLPGSTMSPYSSSSLVQPILTPRFAISCSDELLTGLGNLMKEDPMLPMQTHLAENPSEISFTKSLFPFADSYTHIYDHFDLLRNNSVLAHCVHLAPEEMALIKRTKAGISHCPTSNFNLRSGTSKIADMLDRGIKVSLGTDVSGGFGLGILTTLRQASVASKTIVFLNRDAGTQPDANDSLDSHGSVYPPGYFSSRHLSLETLFYLATLGGAEVTCLEDRIGNFVVGKEFDALLVQSGQKSPEEAAVTARSANDTDEDIMKYVELEDPFPAKGMNPAMFVEPDDNLEKVFEKFLFAGDDRNLGSVFVRGRCVGGARPLTPY